MLLCNSPIWRNYFLHVVRNFSVPINSARNGVQEKGIVTFSSENLWPSHCVLVPSAITRRSSTPLLVSPPSQGSRLHMHNWFVFLLFSSPKSNNFLVSFELLPLKYFPIFLVKNVQPFPTIIYIYEFLSMVLVRLSVIVAIALLAAATGVYV